MVAGASAPCRGAFNSADASHALCELTWRRQPRAQSAEASSSRVESPTLRCAVPARCSCSGAAGPFMPRWGGVAPNAGPFDPKPRSTFLSWCASPRTAVHPARPAQRARQATHLTQLRPVISQGRLVRAFAKRWLRSRHVGGFDTCPAPAALWPSLSYRRSAPRTQRSRHAPAPHAARMAPTGSSLGSQVGACIVNAERVIVGIGYNGFPRCVFQLVCVVDTARLTPSAPQGLR